MEWKKFKSVESVYFLPIIDEVLLEKVCSFVVSGVQVNVYFTFCEIRNYFE